MSTAQAPTTNGTSTSRNVVPSEVGWQFVPQYYTFMNKQPERLHCFYTKQSTFTHGAEGDDVTPCHGQADIHAKITSLDLVDCKVYIHSVDAQASLGGGIVIQVIGEMSNKDEPWRKFVQTFFLAEQPNGYFVLNDVFRFLKEEAVDEDSVFDETTEASGAASEAVPSEEAGAAVEITPEQNFIQQEEEPETNESMSITSKSPVPEPVVPEPEAAAAEEPEHAAAVAGDWVEVEAESSAEPAAAVAPATSESDSPSDDKADTPAATEPVPASSAPTPSAPVNGSAKPSPSPAQSQQQPQAPQAPAAEKPAPAPSGPPAKQVPKTWANLAAANSNKWGSTAASTVASSTAPPPGPAQSPGPKPPQRTPSGQPQQQQQGPPPNRNAFVQGITTGSVFIKGIVDPLTNPQLERYLTQRFGPVKEIEVVRNKACAFVEFTTIEAAKKAIQASLPQSQGGEGGVRIDAGGEGLVRITVETRKERGDRPVSSGAPRGTGRGGFESGRGGGANLEGRGSFRGRGRGRGAPIGGK